jgi:hypothetical protein
MITLTCCGHMSNTMGTLVGLCLRLFGELKYPNLFYVLCSEDVLNEFSNANKLKSKTLSMLSEFRKMSTGRQNEESFGNQTSSGRFGLIASTSANITTAINEYKILPFEQKNQI